MFAGSGPFPSFARTIAALSLRVAMRVASDTRRLRSTTPLPIRSAATPFPPARHPWPFPCSFFRRRRSHHRESNRPHPLHRAHHAHPPAHPPDSRPAASFSLLRRDASTPFVAEPGNPGEAKWVVKEIPGTWNHSFPESRWAGARGRDNGAAFSSNERVKTDAPTHKRSGTR
jgi:hypothetical protein